MNWWDVAVHRALVEAVLVGALAGLIGVPVVLRRLSFFTMALTHATFPGVVAAAIIGVNIYLGGPSPACWPRSGSPRSPAGPGRTRRPPLPGSGPTGPR